MIKKLKGFEGNFKEGTNKSFDFYNILFSSMLTPTEFYLPDSLSKTKNSIGIARNSLKKTKNNLLKLLKKSSGGIEKLLRPFNDTDGNNIEMQLTNNAVKIKPDNDYIKKQSPLANFLKSMYCGSVRYSKKDYGAVEDAGKKIDTFVKLTLLKIIRLYECVLAQLQPQWNKVMGSPEDLDTHAMAMSQKESVSSESARYQIGYEFLRYRA